LEELISINKSIKDNLENPNQKSKEISSYTNENNQISNKKVCGHVGLFNLGATCYMNSIIQQLYMMQTLRYSLMGVDDKDECLSGKRFSPQDDNLLHQLQVMFGYLTLSEKQYYKPNDFCNSFKDFNGNPINTRVQQDSQEFYNNFCDKIEELLKKTKYKYIINDILTGKTCSSVKCNSCNYISNRFEDFYNLSLEVNNLKNLNESLKKFVIEEKIDDFKCDNCQNKVTIEKRTSLAKLPNVLLIHLKRFLMNYEYDRTEKINSKFEFPLSLNLEDFCVENFQLKAEENESDEIYQKKKRLL
jgi:ubiquitin C-terminal hydrolase